MTDEGKPTLALNPWLNIWFRPRRTMRALTEFDPRYGVVLIAALSGIYRYLNQFVKQSFGDTTTLTWILIYAIFFGTVVGIVAVQASGWLLHWVGNRLGGQATKEEARAAVGWASIPDVILLIIFGIIIAVFGEAWFRSDFYGTIDADRIRILLAFLVPAGIVLLAWRFVLTVITLAEVHRFSVGRSIATLIIAGLLIVVPIALLWLGQQYLPIWFPQFERAT